MALKCLLLVISVVYFVNCENTEHANTNSTDQHVPVQKSSRKGRQIGAYLGMISCAMKYDVSCFVDAAEDYLEERRTELLAEADAEVARATGRSDPATRPSHIADAVGKLISELVKMFQNGISGYFKSARESDDVDLNKINSDENESTDLTTNSNGEARGKKKKKKKKLATFLKFLALGAIIYKKICLILKLFHATLHYKFFLLALAGLLLHAIKIWASLKKDHNPSKVIYYEHAQHQHHYDHGEDGHGLWARAFNGESNVTAPQLAYHAQLPYLVVAVTDNIL